MASVKYNINMSLTQSSSTSCWYAAYCMLYDFKGKPTSSIRDKIEKNGLDYRDYWMNGLPDTDYWKTRTVLGLSGFRRPTFYGYAGDIEYFADILKRYGPFWCAFSIPSEHAIIVRGVDTDKKKILVVNPYSYTGTAEEETYSATEFQARLGRKDVASAAQMFFD